MTFMLNPSRVVDVTYPIAPALFGAARTVLVWPDKSSEGVLGFGFNLSSWRETIEGVPTSLTMAVSPSGDAYDVALSTGVIYGDVLAFTAASGLPGTNYKISASVKAADGSSETFTALLPINYNSPATPPPLALYPPGAPPMTVMLNQTAGSIDAPFLITAAFTGFSVVTAPNNYVKLPANPGIPIVILHQRAGGDTLIVLPPDGNTSINGLPNGASTQIVAPSQDYAVQPASFVYGTVSPTPTQIEAF